MYEKLVSKSDGFLSRDNCILVKFIKVNWIKYAC